MFEAPDSPQLFRPLLRGGQFWGNPVLVDGVGSSCSNPREARHMLYHKQAKERGKSYVVEEFMAKANSTSRRIPVRNRVGEKRSA